MRSRERINRTGKAAAGAFLTILFAGMIPVMSLPAAQADASVSLEKMKSMAEAQHEIVVILIRKKQYEEAAAEANKIFEMNWPDNQEPLLVKEMRCLTDHFLRSGQAPLGLRIIERNFGHFKHPSSQAALLKEMGYLYKTMNHNDKALDCFRKARDLEGGK